MSDRSDAHETVLEQLRTFGLSTYAARTFAALVSLDRATAREVSSTAAVPRTRVYDAVDELVDRGLVSVEESSPKRFWPISPETVGTQFERKYLHHANVLRDSLERLESNASVQEQRGVWTTTGHDAISEQIESILRSADEDVIFASSTQLLNGTTIDELTEAQHRGVSVCLGETTASAEVDIGERLSKGNESTAWPFERPSDGRLLIVDSQRVLFSTVLPAGQALNNGGTETALWGERANNDVIAVLCALLGHSRPDRE